LSNFHVKPPIDDFQAMDLDWEYCIFRCLESSGSIFGFTCNECLIWRGLFQHQSGWKVTCVQPWPRDDWTIRWCYMFTKNELTDVTWTKLLKIMFVVERTHWENLFHVAIGMRIFSVRNIAQTYW